MSLRRRVGENGDQRQMSHKLGYPIALFLSPAEACYPIASK